MDEVSIRSQGQTKAIICEEVAGFERDYMGWRPKDIHTHLLCDHLVAHVIGVPTAAEQQLVKTLPAEKGRDLLKQVRTNLVGTVRPGMEVLVLEASAVDAHRKRHSAPAILPA